MKPPPQNELNRVLAHLLKPLVGFLIRIGFTYPQFIQLLRSLYVELAENSPDEDGQPPTASRVSLLTGIARRYIREIRAQKTIGNKLSPKWSPGAKLIAEWTTHPRFTDNQGQPLALPRLAGDGSAASFEELANMATTEIRPRTQLDHLLERKLVQISENDQVILINQAYQPGNDPEEQLHILGEHIHDHIAAGTHNVGEPDRRFFERSAYQDGLSEASIRALEQFIEDESMKTLRRVYKQAAELAHQDKDKHGSESSYRIRLGIYSYSDAVTQPENDSSTPPDSTG